MRYLMIYQKDGVGADLDKLLTAIVVIIHQN